MICPKCGVENVAHAKFCKNCGTALQKESTINEGQKKGGIYLFCSLIVVAICIGAIVYYYQYRGQGVAAEETVIEDLSGNYSIQIQSKGEEFFFTGRMTGVGQNDYILHVVTEYGPERVSIQYNPETGELHSDFLGKGEVSVSDVTSAVTLTFKEESVLWKLTK